MTAMLTALVIDDEKAIRRMLRAALEPAGYRVIEAESGQLGLQETVGHRPDIIILDLGLPDMDGLMVLKRLREWSQVPVLVLSVRDQEVVKVAALDAGANDYLTKPFGTAELLARLRVLQRQTPGTQDEPVFTAGSLKVDRTARRVIVGDKEISLTPTEYALLIVLIQHAGKVVTQKHLLRSVWGPNAEEESLYLRVYITHLRKKLETGSKTKWIKTEPGIGYRFLTCE